MSFRAILRAKKDWIRDRSQHVESWTRPDKGGHWAISRLSFALFQNESKCKTFHMKMSLVCMKMNLLEEHIFTWTESQKTLFDRGNGQLGHARISVSFPGRLSCRPSTLVSSPLTEIIKYCSYKYDKRASRLFNFIYSLLLVSSSNVFTTPYFASSCDPWGPLNNITIT